jgi:hypothetical protein
MLSEKFSEFGDVQHLEEKGTGSMLVVYAADWQAERAISILYFLSDCLATSLGIRSVYQIF